MKARRSRRSRLATVAIVAAGAVAGCSSASTTPAATNPDLRSRGLEAAVVVTTPDGAESLPTWRRQSGRATLVIPADLLFARDSSDLGPAAAEALGLVVDEVRSQLPSPTQVLVEGHADSDGDAGHNQDLSERRAAAVADRLIARGVDPSSITTAGWGEARPAVEETEAASQAANRRVVVTVTRVTQASSTNESRGRVR